MQLKVKQHYGQHHLGGEQASELTKITKWFVSSILTELTSLIKRLHVILRNIRIDWYSISVETPTDVDSQRWALLLTAHMRCTVLIGDLRKIANHPCIYDETADTFNPRRSLLSTPKRNGKCAIAVAKTNTTRWGYRLWPNWKASCKRLCIFIVLLYIAWPMGRSYSHVVLC